MHCGLCFNEVQWQSLESIQITREKDRELLGKSKHAFIEVSFIDIGDVCS